MGLRGERAIIRSSEGHEESGSLTSAMSKRRESSLSVSTSDVLMWRLVVLELIMDGDDGCGCADLTAPGVAGDQVAPAKHLLEYMYSSMSLTSGG